MLSNNSMGTEKNFNCLSENTSSDTALVQKAIDNQSVDSNNTHFNSEKQSSSLTQSSSSSKVPFVPLQIDENDVIEGAQRIICAIRPHWNLNYVEYKKFTDGITNKLLGCFYNPPHEPNITSISNGVNSANISTSDNVSPQDFSRPDTIRNEGKVNTTDEENNDSGNLSDADADSESETQVSTKRSPVKKSPSDVVLIRVYGKKTDLLIDRKAETRNIILLHSYGFAPTLFATFKNGLVYDFVPGVTLNTESVLLPEVWPLVAQRMAEMHRIVKPDWYREGGTGKPTPMLWKKTQDFFNLVPEQFSDANKHKRLAGTFLPINRMRNEFSELYKHLEALDSPVVFAHNDLLLGNVVYTESRKTVTFIDYEYSDFNYQAFDIGNHFAEFAGVDTVDYTRYPCQSFQMQWLRVYLQSYYGRTDVTDAEVQLLYVQVNQFSLASHFFWVIWSLIQAEHSTIDFDYVEYAFLRYNEYMAKREKFLSLDTNQLTKCKI